MAIKHRNSRFRDGHLARKMREAAARIAGKGRRVLFTKTNLVTLSSGGSGLFSTTERVSTSFFKSAGDSITIDIGGFFTRVGTDIIGVSINILDQDSISTGASWSLDLLTGNDGGGVLYGFKGQFIITRLSDGEDLFVSNEGAYSATVAGTPVPFVEGYTATGALSGVKELLFLIQLTAGVSSSITAGLIRAEYSPAVIE